ncbi:MAG: NUDIX hydrolase [Pseudomonadota bacterium]
MDPKSAPEPRLSATVLLVRDRDELEVLMVRRHYQIDFASGALVFPGGKASDDDHHNEWPDCIDGNFTGYQRIARIAAVREAFEESGILLCRSSEARGEGAPLVGADIADKLSPHRAAVDKGELSFLELIRDHALVLALDTLIHFGHWITPTMMPKRFDTHFYFAPTPPAQLASHDGHETTDAMWLTAPEALRMEAAGEANIIFPTRMNLRKLAMVDTVPGGIAQFSSEPVVTVLPEVGKSDDGRPCLHIPDVAGYGQTTELLERVKV